MNSATTQTTPTLKKPPLDWWSLSLITAVHGVALLAPWFFSWSALAITLVLHWLLGSIGICLGYHRLLSHRSFRVPKVVEYAIALIGAAALQGGPIFWVAGHRLHHAHTEDTEQDPYSAKRGFWWSHMLWIFYPKPEFFDYEQYRRFARDLDREPFYRWLNRYHLLLQFPIAIALYIAGGWSWVIYSVFVRAVLLWHSTWFINSVTHVWGYRRFETTDNSRNLWWAALLTYGEGWYNNHHAYPNMAKAGWRWWELDVTWWAIRLLQMLGIAQQVILPPKRTAAPLP